MNIYLLGATGSIGTQTLDVIRTYKEDFSLVACSLGRNLINNCKIIEEFKPKAVCCRNVSDYEYLVSKYPELEYFVGDEGLVEVACFQSGDDGVLVNALTGSIGLIPTCEAIKKKRNIALANKETLVTAGEIVCSLVKEYNVKLLPIDSEHSAIWQCLNGESNKDVRRLIITASGGSFRNKNRDELANVTVRDALNHPNWSMGPKITIDSATMMNKGFEVIEAHFLFDIPYDKIDTILHRESIVHSMVEFEDSSVIAQLGTPDMRIPIIHALGYPKRLPFDSRLDLLKVGEMHFEELSLDRYLCLKYAIDAGISGGIMPAVLNAVNEACVALFLNEKISFLDIEKIIKEELDNTVNIINPTLEQIIRIDKEVKDRVTIKYGGLI